jgi:hypothetical protein
LVGNNQEVVRIEVNKKGGHFSYERWRGKRPWYYSTNG